MLLKSIVTNSTKLKTEIRSNIKNTVFFLIFGIKMNYSFCAEFDPIKSAVIALYKYNLIYYGCFQINYNYWNKQWSIREPERNVIVNGYSVDTIFFIKQKTTKFIFYIKALLFNRKSESKNCLSDKYLKIELAQYNYKQ